MIQKRNGITVLSLVIIAVLCASVEAMACATCGCSLNTDWYNLDYTCNSGLKVDIRYDYLNQDQLRSGTGTISPVAASQIVNGNGNQEVEKFTESQFVTLGIDYSPNRDWGINLQAPYIVRMHDTLGTESNGITGGPGGGQYESDTAGLGDIKVIGRYQGFTSKHNIGVLLGFKLATGSYTENGSSTDPTAPGPVPIDRGLQPGTGTTDVIVGGYYNNALGRDWGYFTQVTYQTAMYATDDYKPGNCFNAILGVRYAGFDYVVPQLQLNFRNLQRDRGANADTISTGGTLLYISPGVVAAISDRISMYVFVQLPLFQDLDGVQLAPRFIPTVGVRYSF